MRPPTLAAVNSTSYPALAIAVWIAAFAFGGVGCRGVVKHQKGGRTAQSLGVSVPPTDYMGMPPEQFMEQPENPEGQSQQELTETTTTTKTDGSVVTVVKAARTVIGGSQSLSDIMKAYAASEYFKRISLALIMGVIAFAVRKEWPSLQWALGIGAVFVAYFGVGALLACLGVAAGIVFAYYVVKSQNPLS